MSQNSIRQALATALNAMTPGMETAWENIPFVPSSEPYQIVNILFAKPENKVLGVTEYWERGYMQVKLMYPQGEGAFVAGSRAELIRSTFKRGVALVSGGITVNIEETPEPGGGQPEDGRYAINIKIPFYAHITI